MAHVRRTDPVSRSPDAEPAGALPFWETERFTEFMERTMRRYIRGRPYAIRATPGTQAYMQFAPLRRITIGAHFPRSLDPRALTVPARWGSVTLRTRGQLVAYILRAVIGHECLHVLLTQPLKKRDFSGPYHADLTNIGEDGRIEAWAPYYSALLAHDIRELSHRLWLRGFHPSGDWPIDLSNACLFARWNEREPARFRKEIVFDDPARSALWERIAPINASMWQARETREVKEIAREIMRLGGIPPDYRFPGGLSLPPGLLKPLDDFPQGEERSPFDGPEHEGEAPDKSKPPASAPPDGDAGDEFLGSSALDCDPSHGLLWPRAYKALQDEVQPMVLEWERRLTLPDPVSGKTRSSRSGTFDLRGHIRTAGRLPFVRDFGSPGVSVRAVAFGLLIDTSGSMGGRPTFDATSGLLIGGQEWDDPALERNTLASCKRAALALERYCAHAGIPIAIAACCNQCRWTHPGHGPLMLRSPAQWIKRFHTPATMEGPRALLSGLYAHGGVENASLGLRAMAEEFASAGITEDLRVLLYLHDGNPEDELFAHHGDYSSAHPVRDTVNALRSDGLTVLGVYIGDDPAALEAIFGQNGIVIVPDHRLLPERLGLLLGQLRLG